jgi:hypothetical protein
VALQNTVTGIKYGGVSLVLNPLSNKRGKSHLSFSTASSICATKRRTRCFLDFCVAELYCTTKSIGNRIVQRSSGPWPDDAGPGLFSRVRIFALGKEAGGQHTSMVRH